MTFQPRSDLQIGEVVSKTRCRNSVGIATRYQITSLPRFSVDVFPPAERRWLLPLHCSGWSSFTVTVPEMDSPGLYTSLFFSKAIVNSWSFPIFSPDAMRNKTENHLCVKTTALTFTSSSPPLLVTSCSADKRYIKDCFFRRIINEVVS